MLRNQLFHRRSNCVRATHSSTTQMCAELKRDMTVISRIVCLFHSPSTGHYVIYAALDSAATFFRLITPPSSANYRAMLSPPTARLALLYCFVSTGCACIRSSAPSVSSVLSVPSVPLVPSVPSIPSGPSVQPVIPPVRGVDGASCLVSMTDTFTPSDFLSCTEIDSFNNKPIASNVGALNCDFTHGETCRFYNAESDQLEWRFGQFRSDGPAFEDKFATLVGRPPGVVPDGGFVFVGEPLPREPADSAILRADFECQRGVGHVTFDFWRSSENLRIYVCTNSITGSTASRFCTNPVDYDLSVPVTLPVEPPGKGPFFVELVVTGMTAPSVLILDNLSYTADLCNTKLITANVVQQAPLVSTISVIKKSGKLFDACSALTCDFSDTTCNFSQAKDESGNPSAEQWQLAHGRIGNPHTGIKRVNTGDLTALKTGFAYVGKDMANNSDSILFALESPNFTLEKETLLSFDFYQRSYGVKFRVCFNDLANCPYSNPPLNKEMFWYEGESVMMPKSTKKVFFVAAKMKRNTWIALDNIVVNQGLGCNPLQPSISPLLLVSSI